MKSLLNFGFKNVFEKRFFFDLLKDVEDNFYLPEFDEEDETEEKYFHLLILRCSQRLSKEPTNEKRDICFSVIRKFLKHLQSLRRMKSEIPVQKYRFKVKYAYLSMIREHKCPFRGKKRLIPLSVKERLFLSSGE